jgi:hypothetical protein
MKLLRFSCVSLAIVLGFLVIVASVRPGGRFTDMGDGSVRDNNSGLIWLKCGGCTDISGDAFYAAMDWNYANDVAAPSLADGLCGLTDGSSEGDWRIPTLEEWEELFFCGGTLIYTSQPTPIYFPCGNQINDAFCDLQWGQYYWSSREHRDNATAIIMTNANGMRLLPVMWYRINKNASAFILPVRDP